MAVNPYITLTDSNSSKSKKFAVLQGGWQKSLNKLQTVDTTLDGNLDISVGAILEKHTYTIRVRETEDRDGYGTEEDLEYFYSLNSPGGTPSNVVTMTDHFGVSRDTYMLGEHTPSPIGVMLQGSTAWFITQCIFQFIPEGS